MHLFVYGTLMTAFNNLMAVKLRREATFVGKAFTNGLLFDLGDYPGFTISLLNSDIVYGEVFYLGENLELLKILDAYEGIGVSTYAKQDEYRREVVSITLTTTQEKFDAFTYFYNLNPEGKKRIVPGNYLNYLNLV